MTLATESPRQRLVATLCAAGTLTQPEWIDAFAAVPRTVFAPRFYHVLPGGEQEWIDSSDPEQYARWLDVVYTDDSLVTHHNPQGTATSSSTQPSVTAMMLEALELEDHHRVLEIGTGTAYNCALLCHRLGDEQVTSIDIDPDLVTSARTALDAVGFSPTLIVGDGLDYEDGALYDRVIATCSTNRVPAAWIKLCIPGGVVLANVGVGVMKLTVADDGTCAEGKSLGFAGFIEARSADGPRRLSNLEAIALQKSNHRVSGRVVSTDYGDPAFLAWLAIAAPDLTWVEIKYEGSDDIHYLFASPDRSWTVGTYRPDRTDLVQQGGSRDLWDTVSYAHVRWELAGRPSHDRFGLTVTTEGKHTLWVDEPGSHDWSLA